MDFEWDAANLRHVLEERSRGVNPALVDEISNGAPKLFPNALMEGRSGSHLMVGPSAEGRFWTIVLLYKHSDLWRPITGWPSTNAEIRLYREDPNNE
jgi:hypothetical protein